MQLCRQFENACNQAYMQGHIRGFMHLDNGQETIPALIADSIKKGPVEVAPAACFDFRLAPPEILRGAPSTRLRQFLGAVSVPHRPFFCTRQT